ncbi:MAG: hypothetical protein IH613_13895 [Desulfuromonadales bacterium]|nr:hypothetical protein [Desulfuromonadales bacterium]
MHADQHVVGILHADDFFAATNTLQLVADVFQDPAVDACYGDLLYVAEEDGAQFTTKRYWKSGDFNFRKFYWGWMPPHPTFFVRKSVYEKYGLFSLELGTAADYELMLRLLCVFRANSATDSDANRPPVPIQFVH